MKLHLTQAENNNLITGYGTADGANFVEINQQRYAQNLIVMADKLILDWPATDFASLSEAHFEQILALKPEVVLLGTGEKHQFLHPKISAPLTHNGISLECMTTAAACRTYNILMSEDRVVAAMLIL
jgi:uncharacterized protein